MEYFKYQNPSVLIKDLYKAKQAKNWQKVNKVNNALIDLRNDFSKRKTSEN